MSYDGDVTVLSLAYQSISLTIYNININISAH